MVGNDPEMEDLIIRQTLQPLGYQVNKAVDVNGAILEVARFNPEVVIADLDLQGLSGNDLLVALTSQGLQIPVIVIAPKGEEMKVIQAFRMGASDFLLWPVKEPEIVAAVERAVRHVREGSARQRLDEQLTSANRELEQRVRELTTIFAVGKAVTAVTDLRVLFDKIVEAIIYVTKADHGWLMLRENQSKTFLLTAYRNLPESWAVKVGQPLDDGVSSLVAVSGETLTIHGDALKRFKVSNLGRSVLVVPVKIQNEVIGLLAVVSKSNAPFNKDMISLVEAVTDYAAISIVNARLFRTIQESAEKAQSGEKEQRLHLATLQEQVRSVLTPITYPVELLLTGKLGKISSEQKQALKTIRDGLKQADHLVSRR